MPFAASPTRVVVAASCGPPTDILQELEAPNAGRRRLVSGSSKSATLHSAPGLAPPSKTVGDISKKRAMWLEFDRRIDRARAHIETHASATLDVALLARIACMSPSHFAHRFKACVGLSPHDYVVRVRLQQALELLVDGTMLGAEVARITGFCDQGHMTRCFSRVYGHAPRGLVRTARARPEICGGIASLDNEYCGAEHR